MIILETIAHAMRIQDPLLMQFRLSFSLTAEIICSDVLSGCLPLIMARSLGGAKSLDFTQHAVYGVLMIKIKCPATSACFLKGQWHRRINLFQSHIRPLRVSNSAE